MSSCLRNLEVSGPWFHLYYVCECFQFHVKNSILTYLLPGMPLACRAATKVVHFCLSLAIFSIVPQEIFIDFSSPSTVCSMCSLIYQASFWCPMQCCSSDGILISSNHMSNPFPTPSNSNRSHTFLITLSE